MRFGDFRYTADDKAADELIQKMDPIPPQDTDSYNISMKAVYEAESLTEAHWQCVKYVASVLLERETPDQAQCQEVLKEAYCFRR